MRLLPLLALAPLALARTASEWAAEAQRSRDGVIHLPTAAAYDELVGALDRDFGVTVVLTALPEAYKCAPCRTFDPVYRAVADSWRRKAPRGVRDDHVFAELDFSEAGEIFQRLGLTSAPVVYFHSKDGKTQTYDLNRSGLGLGSLHTWVKSTTPVHFDLYKPFNPIPLIITLAAVAFTGYIGYAAWDIILPIVTSRALWGIGTIILCLVFTSGYMWNKIKNAPYVQVAQDGRVSWIAGGYSNQLGLESQVVGALYGALALCVVVLTVVIPAQSSPVKQRLGVFLWTGMLIVLASMLFRLFRLKNGGYPFHLL
ncbi:oligosaccharyl transferase subunit ost3/OST6 [Vanrija albida]|uniref:Oligosaccharyl transferase subunit ost3/OST6 n=1 Tax=Vanrija albida TaxID=181172 RepID=A0ABR3Q2V1_9TREE